MNAFIKRHQYNYIKKSMRDLGNAFSGCVDINIIEATKAYIQEKILNLFVSLSEEEKALLDISNITDQLHIDRYLYNLNEYVYGMPNVTNAQINRLFKKEKKLKLPSSLSDEYSKHVYLGWVDEATNKIFVAYNLEDKLVGMACRITGSASNNTHVCCLCNRVGKDNEVAFVSPVCKTSSTAEGAYKSIGFNICLDSEKCNDRITSTDKLEQLLKEVNNIK